MFQEALIDSNSPPSGGFNLQVLAVLALPDGSMVVGGEFTQFKGQSVNRIAKLSSAGVLDTTFQANVGSGFSGAVRALALHSDGSIIVGGSFTTLNGQTANRIAKLSSTGVPDIAFQSNVGTGFDDFVYSLAVLSDGSVIVGGGFRSWKSLFHTRHIAKLSSAGVLDEAFQNNVGADVGGGFNGNVNALVVLADGSIVAGGAFQSWQGTMYSANRIAKLSSAGILDTTFQNNMGTGANGGFNGTVNGLSKLGDGSIIVGGSFTSWQGVANNANRIAKLIPTGVLDETFQSNVGTGANGGFNGAVNAIAETGTGMIIVGGAFNSWQGVEHSARRVAVLVGTLPAPPPPPQPPSPVVKKPQGLPAGAMPSKIKPRGTTVLNKRNAKTKEGRPLTARARVTGVRGEVRCFKLIKGKQRQLSIRTYGKCSFRLLVTYTAAGSSTSKPFKKTRTYRVKR